MRIIRSVVLVLALLLAVSGCGDDSDKNSSDSSKNSSNASGKGGDKGDKGDNGGDTGGDTGGDPSGDLKPGCSYLTPADIKSATGIDGAGTDSSQSTAAICNWEGDGGSVNISVKLETGTFDETVAATESAGGPSSPLSGVGDEAAIFYTDEIIPQSIVIAQAGDKIVSVIYTTAYGATPAEDDVKAAATELSKKLVANL